MERMDDNLPTAALVPVPVPGQVDRTILLFDKLESSIGRDSSCDHRIVSMQVSRKHATIKYENDAWWIYDLRSTNGILVQGIRLEPGEKRQLEDGYTVYFGPAQKSEFKYIFHKNYSPSAGDSDFSNVKHSSSLNREIAQLKAKLATVEAQLKRQDEYSKLISNDLKVSKRVFEEKVAKYDKKIRHLNTMISKYRTLITSLPKDSSSNDKGESKHEGESHFVSQAAVLSMLREVTCPICSEYLVSPTSLNCSHVFCQHCIDTWKKEYCRTHHSRDALCPVCRKKIQFQTQPRAFENLIDIILANVLNGDDLEERGKLVEARKKQPLITQNDSSSSLDSFTGNMNNVTRRSRANFIQHDDSNNDEDEDEDFSFSSIDLSQMIENLPEWFNLSIDEDEEMSEDGDSGDDVQMAEGEGDNSNLNQSESIVISDFEE